jgi:hypothetical protein
MGIILGILALVWVGLQYLFALILGQPTMDMQAALPIFFGSFANLNVFLDIVLVTVLLVAAILYVVVIKWIGFEFVSESAIKSFRNWALGLTVAFGGCSAIVFGVIIVARVLVTIGSLILANNWMMIGSQESVGPTIWLVITIVAMCLGG